MNYKITLQYDGSRYDGWQKQGNTDNTIQGKLEAVLEKCSGAPVEVHGAGRTDAGVHALGQTANFHLNTELANEELKDYLNRYLPADIEVTELIRVPLRFHSRLNVVEKTYRYRIGIAGHKNVFMRKYIYQTDEALDTAAMKKAAEILTGTHDFRSFCANKRMKKSTVRTITRIMITELPEEIQIDVTGNGFLYHMVRILAGTLIEVGKGSRLPDSMQEILQKRDRMAAGMTAPAQGLMLMEVKYEREQE